MTRLTILAAWILAALPGLPSFAQAEDVVRLTCRKDGWTVRWEGPELRPQMAAPSRFSLHLTDEQAAARYDLNLLSTHHSDRRMLEYSGQYFLAHSDTTARIVQRVEGLARVEFIRSPKIGLGSAGFGDVVLITVHANGTLKIEGQLRSNFVSLVPESPSITLAPGDCQRVKLPVLPPVGAAHSEPPRIEIRARRGYGSGFVAKLPGPTRSYLTTDSHVLKGKLPVSVYVESRGGSWAPLTIHADSRFLDFPDQDVAFIELRDEDVKRLEIEPFELNDFSVPRPVLYAYSYAGLFGPVRPVEYSTHIETFGLLGAGVSGAALVDDIGRLVGIYQQYEFNGFRSKSLSARELARLLRERPNQETRWDASGRRYLERGGRRWTEFLGSTPAAGVPHSADAGALADDGRGGGIVAPDDGRGGGIIAPDDGRGGGIIAPDDGRGGGFSAPDDGRGGGAPGPSGATDASGAWNDPNSRLPLPGRFDSNRFLEVKSLLTLKTANGAFLPAAGASPDGKHTFRILISKEPYLNYVTVSDAGDQLENSRLIPITDPHLKTGWYDTVRSMLDGGYNATNWMKKLPHFSESYRPMPGSVSWSRPGPSPMLSAGPLMYSIRSKKDSIRFKVEYIPTYRKAKNGAVIDLTITPDGAKGSYLPDRMGARPLRFETQDIGLVQVVKLYDEKDKALLGSLSFKIDVMKRHYQISAQAFDEVLIIEN